MISFSSVGSMLSLRFVDGKLQFSPADLHTTTPSPPSDCLHMHYAGARQRGWDYLRKYRLPKWWLIERPVSPVPQSSWCNPFKTFVAKHCRQGKIHRTRIYFRKQWFTHDYLLHDTGWIFGQRLLLSPRPTRLPVILADNNSISTGLSDVPARTNPAWKNVETHDWVDEQD